MHDTISTWYYTIELVLTAPLLLQDWVIRRNVLFSFSHMYLLLLVTDLVYIPEFVVQFHEIFKNENKL